MRTIDADKLLSERMKSKYYHLPNGDIAIPIIDIENAPTIKPERKTGHWIDDGIDGCGALMIEYRNIKCDQCGWSSSLVIPRNFCPNCGADMRGEKHDAD